MSTKDLLKDINIFCEEVNLKNFLFLSKQTQDLFHKYSKKCIKHNKGKIDIAKKIELYYTVKDFTQKRISEIRAIFTSLKLLETSQFKKIRNTQGHNSYPMVGVSFQKDDTKFDTSLLISYEAEFKDLFFISQTEDILGVDKELNLTKPDLKQYIVDLFQDYDISISGIVIYLSPILVKPFYTKKQGIVWSQEAIMKLKPKIGSKIKYENKDVFREQLNKWECPKCLLMNSMDKKKCIACGIKRQTKYDLIQSELDSKQCIKCGTVDTENSKKCLRCKGDLMRVVSL